MCNFTSVKAAKKAAATLNKNSGIGHRAALEAIAKNAGFSGWNAMAFHIEADHSARGGVAAPTDSAEVVPVLDWNGRETGIMRMAPGLMDDLISFAKLVQASRIKIDLVPGGAQVTLRMHTVDQLFVKFHASHWPALKASAEHYLGGFTRSRVESGASGERIIVDLHDGNGWYPRLSGSVEGNWRRISCRTGVISVICSPDSRLLQAMLFDQMKGYSGPDPVKFADVSSTHELSQARDQAVSGRSVFFTIRARDGKEALERIKALDPGFAGSTPAIDLVDGIMAVRAVRTLCRVCRGTASGCRTCLGTRYEGVSLVTALEKRTISNGWSSSTADSSWRAMFSDIRHLLSTGNTDIPEIKRVFGDVMSTPEIDSLEELVDPRTFDTKQWSFLRGGRSPVNETEFERLMTVFDNAKSKASYGPKE